MVNLTLMLSLPIYMFFQPITTLLKKEVTCSFHYYCYKKIHTSSN
ncbi:unnamed protein product [Brassica rapa subsp. trilocularis]